MISYELAIRLKEAGFPQNHQFVSDGIGNSYCFKCHLSDFENKEKSCLPTLSELIEACEGKWGQRFRWLGNEKTHWSAQARPIHGRSKEYPDSPIEIHEMGKDIKAIGKTPEEAVAALWIALNKK